MNKTEQAFQQTVWSYYQTNGRHDLPWRAPEPNGNFSPYKILVSELMLQQTQVSRVIPKYYEFLTKFPTAQALAQASMGDVLTAWSGLGYNRRAKFLRQAAQMIEQDFAGRFPDTLDELIQLPGVGKNTAGAVLAYAFNQPIVFIETNIRTVYIHHFFQDRADISDSEIVTVLEKTSDPTQPRIWYWALMDYGSYLKRSVGNLTKLSKSYAKQSKFEGSKRQIRGKVIRLLAAGPLSARQLKYAISDDRLALVLTDLVQEALIRQVDGVYSLH